MKVPLRRTELIVTVVFGLVVLFYLPLFKKDALAATLDNSWVAVITWAAAKPLQFGRDIIFSYGPLGHLMSAIYSPRLFVPELVARIAIHILFLILLFVLSRRLRLLRRIALILSATVVAQYNPQGMYLFMIVAAAWLAFVEPSPNRALLMSGLAFNAATCFVKGTFLFFTLAVMILGLTYLIWQRAVRPLALSLLSFTLAFLAVWLLAGQQLSGIPAYLSSSFEIASGYGQAMSLQPRAAILAAGLAGFGSGNLQIMAALVRHRGERGAWFISLVLGLALFTVWKLSFTRADDHTIHLFYYGIIAVLALPIFYADRGTAATRFIDYPTIVVMVACGIFVIHDQTSISFADVVRDTRGRYSSNFRALIHPASTRSTCEATFRFGAQMLALPQIKRTIGQATVDVFGYEQAVAIANDLNYTPRPIFQGYSAYTPALVKRNADFYRSAGTPEYVIFRLQTIDTRLPDLDDAEALLVLAQDYRPILTERGYTLLKRKMDAPGQSTLRIAGVGETALGDSVSVPKGVSWCQIHFRETLVGKLVGFIYQLPEICVEFEGSKMVLRPQRIVPRTAANGFLISPLLQTDPDFLDFVNGNRQEAEIHAFRILPPVGAKWFLQPRVSYQFSEMAKVNENNPPASP